MLNHEFINLMPSITDDTRISSLKELAAPSDLLTQIPLDETVAAHVTQARGANALFFNYVCDKMRYFLIKSATKCVVF